MRWESIDNLPLLFKPIADHFKNVDTLGKLWWRGHSDSSWNLEPSVMRVKTEDNLRYSHEPSIAKTPASSYSRSFERGSASYFLRKAGTRAEKIPPLPDNGGLNGWVEWLTLMQHHELPTRLLDWTQSFLVALFFVLEDKYHEKDGALWVLDPVALNHCYTKREQVYDGSQDNVQKIAKVAFFDGDVSEEMSTVIAFLPHEFHPRMLAQHIAFTIHGGETPIILSEDNKSKSFLLKIEIAASLKENIKRFLQITGMTRASLFPDLSNLASHIKTLRFTS